MKLLKNALLAAAAVIPLTYAAIGTTYTTWDCCKPACAWSNIRPKTVSGSPKVCDVNNNILAGNSDQYRSGCETGGSAYLCADYAPIPVSEDLAYGFAVRKGDASCCKCYELAWRSGAARGKRMVVQVHNIVQTGSGPGATDADWIIAVPGGGSGVNQLGCRAQYGTNWGAPDGGVTKREDCATLPQNLQGGCYWRFNWAGGLVTGWQVEYKETTCPVELVEKSGCDA
ncbi:RlpA-like double-psi beta-barrel-protein domain-containing protein-containing protein [Xylariomycetidae sp. FL0641]|nr:RlpA-like double-psi beta-barrel-protein domain-containing protein-containing protein [Xylariomycetidae sp. FL0641]